MKIRHNNKTYYVSTVKTVQGSTYNAQLKHSVQMGISRLDIHLTENMVNIMPPEMLKFIVMHEIGHYEEKAMTPRKENEYVADLYAARVLGKETALATLQRCKVLFGDQEGDHHPKYSERINNIKRSI